MDFHGCFDSLEKDANDYDALKNVKFMTHGVNIKVFLGCAVNSHLKLQLSQSIGWKNAKIVGQATIPKLVEIAYQGRHYIGLFLPDEETQLSDVKKFQEEALEELSSYIPDVDLKAINFVLFPQIFVT